MNVNERINNECSECMIPHLNILDWKTLSHSLKEENHSLKIVAIVSVNKKLETTYIKANSCQLLTCR